MREGLYRDGAKQGTQRRPLLRASSPLKPKINRGLTLRLVRRTGALHIQNQSLFRGLDGIQYFSEIRKARTRPPDYPGLGNRHA